MSSQNPRDPNRPQSLPKKLRLKGEPPPDEAGRKKIEAILENTFGVAPPPLTDRQVQAVDFGALPVDTWPSHLSEAAALPPDVAAYLEGIEGDEITPLEADSVAERLEAYHGMKPPWGIAFSNGAFRLVRDIDP